LGDAAGHFPLEGIDEIVECSSRKWAVEAENKAGALGWQAKCRRFCRAFSGWQLAKMEGWNRIIKRNTARKMRAEALGY
jgi:hypothetical protein